MHLQECIFTDSNNTFKCRTLSPFKDTSISLFHRRGARRGEGLDRAACPQKSQTCQVVAAEWELRSQSSLFSFSKRVRWSQQQGDCVEKVIKRCYVHFTGKKGIRLLLGGTRASMGSPLCLLPIGSLRRCSLLTTTNRTNKQCILII